MAQKQLQVPKNPRPMFALELVWTVEGANWEIPLPGSRKHFAAEIELWSPGRFADLEFPPRFLRGELLLGGGNSNIFYFHPEPWGNDPIWLILFEWVETTN